MFNSAGICFAHILPRMKKKVLKKFRISAFPFYECAMFQTVYLIMSIKLILFILYMNVFITGNITIELHYSPMTSLMTKVTGFLSINKQKDEDKNFFMVNCFKNVMKFDTSFFGSKVKDKLTVLLDPQKQLFCFFFISRVFVAEIY